MSTEREVREDFRELTAREREILEFLLSVEAPGIEELRAQIPVAQVARWNCGCSSFDIRVDQTRAPRSSFVGRPAVEAVSKERCDYANVFDLLLWVDDGWLSGLEVVDYVGEHGSDSPDPIPPPETWETPTLYGGPSP